MEGWSCFMQSMDEFGPPGKRLQWESKDGPGRSTHFLDLEIHLQDDGSIRTWTYQKDINLYLYRPPLLPSLTVSCTVSYTVPSINISGRTWIDPGLITLLVCSINASRNGATMPPTLHVYSFVPRCEWTSPPSQLQKLNTQRWTP
jgi:hypothetical protein